MEAYYDEARQAVGELSLPTEEYANLQKKIRKLEEYYTGGQWRKDYEADEAGKIPADLKRGVLSEDAIGNLLDDNMEARKNRAEVSIRKKFHKQLFSPFAKA